MPHNTNAALCDTQPILHFATPNDAVTRLNVTLPRLDFTSRYQYFACTQICQTLPYPYITKLDITRALQLSTFLYLNCAVLHLKLPQLQIAIPLPNKDLLCYAAASPYFTSLGCIRPPSYSPLLNNLIREATIGTISKLS